VQGRLGGLELKQVVEPEPEPEPDPKPDSEPIPAYVETAFLKSLGCGIYSCGFVRLRGASCGDEALLPFPRACARRHVPELRLGATPP